MTEDSSEGIDWSSSNTSTPANMEGVHVPLLIMSMTLHYRMVPAEIFLQHAASQDKPLVFAAGAGHNPTTCTACKQFRGQYGDTVKTTFDSVASWLRSRVVSSPLTSLRVRAWAAPEGPLGGAKGAELPFGWAGGAHEPGRSMPPTGAGQSSTPRSGR